MEKLAFLGGEKAVKIPMPHWKWPYIEERDAKTIYDFMMRDGKMVKGMNDIVGEFEQNFSNYHNMRHTLALNSATSCLHAAYYALDVTEGDEIIVPTFTFPSTGLPLFSLGAIPVLCDCLRENGTIDPEDIKRKITSRTKGIAVTHLWGHPCEMDEIMAIAKENNLFVLEDCAHAPGALYKGKLVGTLGDVSCFSFDSQKLLACGEIGTMLTNSQKIFEKAVIFSDFGGRVKAQLEMEEYKKFNDTGLAVKYRVHPLAAVWANEKFKRLSEYNNSRCEMLDYFTSRLEQSKCLLPIPTKNYVKRGGYYGYKPIYKELNGVSVEMYIKLLWAEGVDIRQTVTPPLHRLELFRTSQNFGVPLNKKYDGPVIEYYPEDFPNAEWFQAMHVSFPTFSRLSDKELIDQYMDAIIKVETYIEKHKID